MSKKTQILTHGLLSGEINGAALQGALENGGFLGAWYSLLQSRDIEELLRSQTALDGIFGSATAFVSVLSVSGAVFAASDAATAAIAASPSASAVILANSDYLDLWNDVPGNKTRLQALYNQSGSCLVRYILTTADSGLWTPPDGDIIYASRVIVGGGGNTITSTSGKGGGGGRVLAEVLPDGLSGDQTISIAAASNTVWGATTVEKGQDGGHETAGGLGAGTTTGTFYDTNLDNALSQYPAEYKGGNGGNGSNSEAVDGSPGQAGLVGTGGAGGWSRGAPGTGISSGGGGGSYHPYQGLPGSTASDPGCGAGGANGGHTGGTGGPGRIWVYGVLGAPKP